MKLMLFLFLVMPAVSYATSLELKKYTCEITFKEPVVGFTNKRESSSDTGRITNRVLDNIVAISSEHAFQKVVDSEVKAGIDSSFLIDTALYVEDASAIKQNKIMALNADREALGSATIKKQDIRKKLYKEFKTITCN